MRPESSSASASATASRTGPLVADESPSRFSQASSMMGARSVVMSDPDRVKETGEIVDLVMDVFGFGLGMFGALLGPHRTVLQPDGRDAEIVRRHEIARGIFEHGGARRRYGVILEHAAIALRVGLRAIVD